MMEVLIITLLSLLVVGMCVFMKGMAELDKRIVEILADEHPKSPWINAKNELPSKGGHYLCMDENNYISTLAFREINGLIL